MFNLSFERKDFEKSLAVLFLSVAILLSICGCERCGSPGPPVMSPPSRDRTIFAGINYGVYKSEDGGDSWEWPSPDYAPYGVRTLAISPNYANDQTIFAGTRWGGVFESIDGGGNWWVVGLSDKTVNALAISPDRTIFAGTEYGGVFKSYGGGDWSEVNKGLTRPYVNALAISPDYENDWTIFAGIRWGGVYKSTNGGRIWSYSGLSLSVKYLAISPGYGISDYTIFAGTEYGGVYKSTDGGRSWRGSMVGLSYEIVEVKALAISPNYATDRTIFAGTTGGVYKSTYGGGGWWECWGIEDEVNALAISPNYANDQTIFAGTTEGVYKSTDGGRYWRKVGIWTSVEALAISPNY